MNTGDVKTIAVGRSNFRNDLIERHARRIDHPRAGGRKGDNRLRYQRSRIQNHRGRCNLIATTHGDEIGRTGPRADEMNRHAAASGFGLCR